MNIEIIGIIAGFLTTSAFVPQVVQVVKTKDTSALALLFILAINIGTLLWFIYGCILGNAVIVISNAIVFVLAFVILTYKIKNIITKKEPF